MLKLFQEYFRSDQLICRHRLTYAESDTTTHIATSCREHELHTESSSGIPRATTKSHQLTENALEAYMYSTSPLTSYLIENFSLNMFFKLSDIEINKTCLYYTSLVWYCCQIITGADGMEGHLNTGD